MNGRQLRDALEARGILVRAHVARGLAEQVLATYKDVSEVVATSQYAGLVRTVARLVPLGVVKG